MATTTYAAAVHSAGVAELLWRTPGGAPRALGVVPLLLGDRPAVALPWAYADDARAAAASTGAALVLSDPRLTGSDWRPLVMTGRLTLVEDGDGSLFADQLLSQEVRKHPPSRALVDSPLLRREHWWYLPRLVLLLDPVSVEPGGRRDGPEDAVLGVDDDGLFVRTVAVGDWNADPMPLTGGPATVSGPAVLVGQEISVPDVERWSVHTSSGTYADGRLVDVVLATDRALGPVPGLFARVRRQRVLEKACIAALKAAGHG